MKKVVLTLTLLFSLLAIPWQSCEASDWYWLTSDSNATQYVDTSTGYRTGQTIHVWTKLVYSNGIYTIAKCNFTYEHKNTTMTILEAHTYYPNGRLIADDYDSRTVNIIPGSNGATVAWKIWDLFKDVY